MDNKTLDLYWAFNLYQVLPKTLMTSLIYSPNNPVGQVFWVYRGERLFISPEVTQLVWDVVWIWSKHWSLTTHSHSTFPLPPHSALPTFLQLCCHCWKLFACFSGGQVLLPGIPGFHSRGWKLMAPAVLQKSCSRYILSLSCSSILFLDNACTLHNTSCNSLPLSQTTLSACLLSLFQVMPHS